MAVDRAVAKKAWPRGARARRPETQRQERVGFAAREVLREPFEQLHGRVHRASVALQREADTVEEEPHPISAP